jgi:general secretion pathway protein N
MNRQAIGLYVAAGCLAYAVALIAMLPAPWMARHIENASNQSVLLRDPAGTVWSGGGRLYVRERAGTLLDIGALRWTASPASIFTGKLAVELALGSAAPSARLQLSPFSLAILGLNLELPGRVIASFAPPLEALGPQGKLLIRSDNLRFDGDSVFGLANIEWRPVRLARAPGLDLGSHVARLRGGGSKVDIELGSLGGPLRLSGAGVWTRERGLLATGAAEHDEETGAALAPFLQGVCTSYANRRCEFRLAQ